MAFTAYVADVYGMYGLVDISEPGEIFQNIPVGQPQRINDIAQKA